jgi:phage tail protein X
MNIVRAHQGESLDGLIWRTARLGAAALPAIFAANPGICETLTLSAGQPVNIPEITNPTPTTTRVSLWN